MAPYVQQAPASDKRCAPSMACASRLGAMSGHSKWATIKRKKGDIDAKRGKIFTKLVREVTTAARMGGADPSCNPRLRLAIVTAKQARMPADNIDRAIKKGVGTLEGPPVEEISYEGYGAAGVALLVEAQTDNRNRTSADVRAAFAKHGGNLGTAGSVAWLFDKCGRIRVPMAGLSEDALMDSALEAGAQDVQPDGDAWMLQCDPKDFLQLVDRLEADKIAYDEAEVVWLPQNVVEVAGDEAERVTRLVEKLDDLDDVQAVWGNFSLADDVP